MIKHEDSKWVLYTKDGSKVLGTHDSQEDAEAQERAIESSKRDAEARHLHLLGAIGKVRFEQLNGRQHIVVPVVALMEGVIHAVNAESPEFVPIATLQKAAASWNGKPVVLNHPVRNGRQCSADSPEIIESYGIGTIFNSRVEGTKLLQEAWIDQEKATRRHPKMVDKLLHGQPVEVSVGAFAGTDTSEGAHNGQRYKGAWLQTQGDHLAFLPDGRGACSLEMGCGAHRAATMRVCEDHLEVVELREAAALPEDSSVYSDEKPTGGERTDYTGEEGTGYVQQLADGKWLGCYTPTDGEKVEQEFDSKDAAVSFVKDAVDVEMRAAIGARNSKTDLGRIQAMHDKAVELGAMCAPKAAAYGKTKDCPACGGTGSKDGNPCESCDGTGKIRAAEAADNKSQEEIDKILTDKAAAGDAAFRAACRCQERDMNEAEKNEIVKALVEDPHSGFTKGDEKMLEAASDERLEAFRVAAVARQKREDELKTAAERRLTKEEFMEVAPAELKSLITRQQKQETEHKAVLITELKANQSEFSEAELSVMSVDELRRLASVAKIDPVKITYEGRGIPKHLASDETDYTPPNPYEKGIKALQGAAR